MTRDVYLKCILLLMLLCILFITTAVTDTMPYCVFLLLVCTYLPNPDFDVLVYDEAVVNGGGIIFSVD